MSRSHNRNTSLHKSRVLTITSLFLSLFMAHANAIPLSCRQIFSSVSSTKKDISDGVLAVHLTNFFPKEGVVRASPANSGRFGVTLHFTLGQPVLDHAFGKWSERKYGVVTPLKNLEPQLLNLFPQDSFVLGDLRLSRDAVVFEPEGDPTPQVPVRIVRYNPEQTSLKESITTYIRNSGSLIFSAEGPLSSSKLTINGKEIDQTEQLRSIFHDIHQRNPRLTSTTHDYTLWGSLDYKIIDLLASWIRLGTPKVVEDSILLLDIMEIEFAIPEVIKVARKRQLPSESAASLEAGLKNLRSYLHLIKLEWMLRVKYQKTILGTDLKEIPHLHQQIISALERPEVLSTLLETNVHLLSSIANVANFKVPALDPKSILGRAKYATMEQFQSIIREFAPNYQKEYPDAFSVKQSVHLKIQIILLRFTIHSH